MNLYHIPVYKMLFFSRHVSNYFRSSSNDGFMKIEFVIIVSCLGLPHIYTMGQMTSIKVKLSPLQAMKAHRGCGYKGPHIHSHGTRMR